MDKARRSMSSAKLRKALPNDYVLGVWWFDSIVPAGSRQLDLDAISRSPEIVPKLGGGPLLKVAVEFQAQPP